MTGLDDLDRIVRSRTTWTDLRALDAFERMREISQQLDRDLDVLAVVGRMYLDAVDADPDLETLTLPQALRITEVREAVERREARPTPLPHGLCGNRDDHGPHDVYGAAVGAFRCTADQETRLPYAAERRRRDV